MALMLADPDVVDDSRHLMELTRNQDKQDKFCSCDCEPQAHGLAGCRNCACRAIGLKPLASDSVNEAAEEAIVQRILVMLRVARRKKRLFDKDRAEREATRCDKAPRVAPKRVTTTKPKATTRAVAPRSRTISRKSVAPLEAASFPVLPVEHSRAAWQDETSELLEAVGAVV
jgi:hypothetical protein